MTTNNPHPKDVFMREALTELERLVENDPEVNPFQTILREYVTSTPHFKELPPGEYQSPPALSSVVVDPNDDLLARFTAQVRNGSENGGDVTAAEDFLSVTDNDSRAGKQQQGYDRETRKWEKRLGTLIRYNSAMGYSCLLAGLATLGLEYVLHREWTPLSVMLTGGYGIIGGLSYGLVSLTESRLKQLQFDGLPAIARSMNSRNTLTRWWNKAVNYGVLAVTLGALFGVEGGLHLNHEKEAIRVLLNSKKTSTLEQKVEEDSSLPRPQLIFDTSADTYEVNSGAVMKVVTNPQTNTRTLLAPYEEKMEGLENINIEPLHDQWAWRELAIREACQEARFDNPDLITAMYHTFSSPRVFDPISWGKVKRFEPVLSGQSSIDTLKDGEEEAYQNLQANNSQFRELMKEDYILPLMEHLQRTGKKYGKANILEALALLVYTDKQLATARQQLKRKEGITDEEELNTLLYLGGQLSKEGKREDRLMFEKEDAFIVPAILHSYFALQHHHQVLRNRKEQYDNQTGKRIYQPKSVPALRVGAYVNDPLQKKKGQVDHCPARYSPQNVQFSIGNRWNAVRPGENVLVRYGVAIPGVRVEGHYGMDQLLEIPDWNMWEEVDSGGQITIPKHAVPGTYLVKFSTGLSDDCRLDLETTITVTNEMIPKK